MSPCGILVLNGFKERDLRHLVELDDRGIMVIDESAIAKCIEESGTSHTF